MPDGRHKRAHDGRRKKLRPPPNNYQFHDFSKKKTVKMLGNTTTPKDITPQHQNI